MPIIAIALVLAAALGGGMSIASQSSVPGDVLYPFKIDIDEQVEGMFATSDMSRANLDIALVQERLKEAQKLAAQGSLTPSLQAQLSANFTAHAQNVSKLVADLQAHGDYQGAATIAAKFQAALAGGSSALASASASGSSDAQASLAPLSAQVATTLNDASAMSTDASAQAAQSGGADASASADASSSAKVSGPSASASSSINKAINLGL